MDALLVAYPGWQSQPADVFLTQLLLSPNLQTLLPLWLSTKPIYRVTAEVWRTLYDLGDSIISKTVLSQAKEVDPEPVYGEPLPAVTFADWQRRRVTTAALLDAYASAELSVDEFEAILATAETDSRVVFLLFSYVIKVDRPFLYQMISRRYYRQSATALTRNWPLGWQWPSKSAWAYVYAPEWNEMVELLWTQL